MSNRYENVKTIEESNDHIVLQIARGLYSIDNTRKVIKEYGDLPAVNTPYVLIESGDIDTQGISGFDKEVYFDVVDDVYKEATVLYQQQTFTITAASNSPEVFLQKFKLKRSSSDFAYTYFTSQDIGVNTISNISDASVPVEGGDWEIRKQLVITVNYMTKEEVIINTIGSIAFDWNVGTDIPDRITGSGEVSVLEFEQYVKDLIAGSNSLYSLLNYDLPETGDSTWINLEQ